MFRATALDPSTIGPWRAPSRLTAYAALCAISFVCYILARMLDGGASRAFDVVGVGACGWSWLLARALFDPARHDVRWARIVGLTVVATGALSVLTPSGGELSRLADNAYGLAGSAALLLTFVEPFHGYRADLPAGEKRFRTIFLAIYTLLIVVSILGLRAADSAAGPQANDMIKAGCAVIGLTAAGAAVWFRLRRPLPMAQGPAKRAATDDDMRLAERVLRLLREEEIHRDPDLRIGEVAARLGQPEYRISQCVSAGLGFANFNRLINHHRIARAKALLADAGEARSILEVAFDCGFGSIGPFNRAFKDEVGVTPRAFRAAARS